MKKIILGKGRKDSKHTGFVALVDDDDFEEINKYSWHLADINNGYASRTEVYKVNGKRKYRSIKMHNQIMGFKFIDHIDHNKLNNQKSNLRKSCPQSNQRNRLLNKNSTTMYKGVKKHGERFISRISLNKKRIHLGVFNTAKEAATAYNDAAAKHFGEFAYLNKIDD